MQLKISGNSEQPCLPNSDSASEKWKQTLAFEQAQAEIDLLGEQVNYLQQYLSEQLQQKQALEQALHNANQELGLNYPL